ncbi:MAG TPA: BTAD domain-containing putative transcriptional regulator [Candidatus Limnocylindrales bacterium]|nr:BTAD domain-containing putative transcriptional regulator [Candidatus Limnocylindrales bacterium]
MTAPARLRLLGCLEVRSPAADPIDIPSRKVRALLAYLALPLGRAHERDSLAALLWGDTTDEHARHSLRQALSVLRRALPAALLLDERVALDPAAVECDAADFERLARAGDPESLEAAARLWTGDLLEGFHVDAEPFEDWLRAERARLHDVAVDALGRLLALRVRSGADGDAIQLSHRLLRFDPSLEPVHRTVMRLYTRTGRRGAALHPEQGAVAAALEDPGLTSYGETVLAWVDLERGEIDAAAAACRRLLDSPGDPANLATASGFLGMTWLERDDAVQAVTLLEQAIRRLKRLPTRYQLFVVPFAEACLAHGDREQARKLAEEAGEAAERTGSPWSRGRAARLRACLAAADGQPDTARGQFELALELFGAVPAPLELARTRLVAGRAALRRGAASDARAQLDCARGIYANLGLTRRLSAVERLAEAGGL